MSWSAGALPSAAAATSTSGGRRSRILARLGLVRSLDDFPELPSDDAITAQLDDAFQGESFRETGIRAFAQISRPTPSIVMVDDDGVIPATVVPVTSGAVVVSQADPEPSTAP